MRGRKCYKNIACTQILSSFKYNNDINNNNKSCIDVYEGLTIFPCAGVSSQCLGTRFLFFSETRLCPYVTMNATNQEGEVVDLTVVAAVVQSLMGFYQNPL